MNSLTQALLKWKLYRRASIALVMAALGLSLSAQASQSLWSVAKPISNGEAADTTTVFQFTTPAAGNLISVSYRFYTTSSSCTGSFTVKTYSPCINSNTAGKTFLVSDASLYQIAVASGVAIASVQCIRQVSPLVSLVGGAATCSVGTQTCGVGFLGSQTLVSQGSC